MNTDEIGTKLYNIGVSYKKADVETRSAFSLSKQKQIALSEASCLLQKTSPNKIFAYINLKRE